MFMYMYNEDGDSHRIKTDLFPGVFEPQYIYGYGTRGAPSNFCSQNLCVPPVMNVCAALRRCLYAGSYFMWFQSNGDLYVI